MYFLTALIVSFVLGWICSGGGPVVSIRKIPAGNLRLPRKAY